VIRGLEDQAARQQEAAEDAAALLCPHASCWHEELPAALAASNRDRSPSCRSAPPGAELSIRSGQKKEVRRRSHRLAPGPGRGEKRQAGRPAAPSAGSKQHRPSPQRREPQRFGGRCGRKRHPSALAFGKAAEVLAITPWGRTHGALRRCLRLNWWSSAHQSLSGEEPAPVGIRGSPKVQIQMPAQPSPPGRSALPSAHR